MPFLRGMTKQAMLALDAESFKAAAIVGDDVVLTRGDGSTENVDSFVTRATMDSLGPSGKLINDLAESFWDTANYISGVTGTPGFLYPMAQFTVLANRPVYVEVDAPRITAVGGAGVCALQICASAGVVTRQAEKSFLTGEVGHMRVFERISTPGFYTRIAYIQRLSGTALFSNNITPETTEVMTSIKVIER